MYVEFYGLKEKPFSTTPDPRFLFLTPSHREALAQLVYGVREGTGFVVLTGEVGTGKTTLLRTLMQRLAPEAPISFVMSPMLDFDELLDYILEDLGIGGGRRPAQRLVAFHSFLVDRAKAGHRTLVIIDEAQHLESKALERIRLLSNFETTSEKLLQIVLAGQPELAGRLALPDLRQFNQRIGLRCTIRPLAAVETGHYVRSRLRIAGARDPRLFTDEAIERVARYTRGIPRVINIVCEHSLLIGYADQVRRIDHRVIREAIRAIEAREERSYGRGWALRHLATARRGWILGASAVAAAGTAGGMMWYTGAAGALGSVAATYGAKVTGLISGVEALLRP